MAPATGIVFEPKASTDGVLGAGDTILTIIPQCLKPKSLLPIKI